MTNEEKPKKDSAQRFVEYLRQLVDREDRGALASLRKSLIDPTGMSASACPYVVPFLGKEPNLQRERSFFLVGALFALHPEHRDGVSLGTAFRRLSSASSSDGTESPSVRARFVALLDAHPEDLADHLRNAISLCRSKDVSLDWDDLLRDTLGFQHPERIVQRRWARHFWGDDQAEQAPNPIANPNTPQVTS